MIISADVFKHTSDDKFLLHIVRGGEN